MVRQAENKKNVRAWFFAYKKGKWCSRCGADHPACLDFHHVDPLTKRMGVSRMVNVGLSIEEVLTEIDKCVILCANCHRILHWEEEQNDDYRQDAGHKG